MKATIEEYKVTSGYDACDICDDPILEVGYRVDTSGIGDPVTTCCPSCCEIMRRGLVRQGYEIEEVRP